MTTPPFENKNKGGGTSELPASVSRNQEHLKRCVLELPILGLSQEGPTSLCPAVLRSLVPDDGLQLPDLIVHGEQLQLRPDLLREFTVAQEEVSGDCVIAATAAFTLGVETRAAAGLGVPLARPARTGAPGKESRLGYGGAVPPGMIRE